MKRILGLVFAVTVGVLIGNVGLKAFASAQMDTTDNPGKPYHCLAITNTMYRGQWLTTESNKLAKQGYKLKLADGGVWCFAKGKGY